MRSTPVSKKLLLQHITSQLEQKVHALAATLDGMHESLGSATKSSAGDKHETGRAMMQIEIENAQAQLQRALAMKSEWSQTDFDKLNKGANSGSLVFTNHGLYLLSIALGKVEFEALSVYVISMASPLGTALRDKKAGESFHCNNRHYTIEALM